MQNEVITVQCPHCGKDVIWDELSPWRPFCSKRCQLKRIPSEGDLNDSDDWSEEQH